MKLIEEMPMRGVFELSILRNGKEIEHYRDDNMIMNVARDALARLVGGDGTGKVIAKIGVGTNGDGPDPADTALKSPYIKNLGKRSYPATGQVTFEFSFGLAEANGLAIREFGLVCSDGTLFARKTRGIIEKAVDIEIHGTWTIIF